MEFAAFLHLPHRQRKKPGALCRVQLGLQIRRSLSLSPLRTLSSCVAEVVTTRRKTVKESYLVVTWVAPDNPKQGAAVKLACVTSPEPTWTERIF